MICKPLLPPPIWHLSIALPNKLIFSFVFGVLITNAVIADEIVLQWNFDRVNDLKVKIVNANEIEFTTLGTDPFIELQRFDADQVGPDYHILSLESFAPEPVHGLHIYFGPPIRANTNFSVGDLDRSESWLPWSVDLIAASQGVWDHSKNLLRIDFGRKAGVTFRIRNLKLRSPTSDELKIASQIAAERELKLSRQRDVNSFYQRRFEWSIKSVELTADHVRISGECPGISGLTESDAGLMLLELLPEISVATDGNIIGQRIILRNGPAVIPLVEITRPTVWELEIDRTIRGRDRSTSRFAMAKKLPEGNWELKSHWKYVTDFSPDVAPDLPRMVPQSIKGMGGISTRFQLNDLVDLGIHNITVNLVLGSILDITARPGWEQFHFGGKDYFVNPGLIQRYDLLMKFAAENEIVVSAILLVNFSEHEFGRRLRHPDATRAGHYAMPNFTTRQGVQAYEAVLEFLAQRYCRVDGKYGRIANWIVHNEVGYGFEWTNMGHQPPMLYMDHYLRSLRLVHNVMRRHDPHARVFISLTHHWNNPTLENWRSYSNLRLLERLIESSKIEGDFAWGIAYHPYPQNLRKPDAWNDKQAIMSLETRYITPRNISVLQDWMSGAEVRDENGQVRGLLLSEQGFNTPDYSDESQELQAAALVYMWEQMTDLSAVEAFHYHRWVDSPQEGGLLLGLRTLPTTESPMGKKKQGWEVYRKLDTSQMEELKAKYRHFYDHSK